MHRVRIQWLVNIFVEVQTFDRVDLVSIKFATMYVC